MRAVSRGSARFLEVNKNFFGLIMWSALPDFDPAADKRAKTWILTEKGRMPLLRSLLWHLRHRFALIYTDGLPFLCKASRKRRHQTARTARLPMDVYAWLDIGTLEYYDNEPREDVFLTCGKRTGHAVFTRLPVQSRKRKKQEYRKSRIVIVAAGEFGWPRSFIIPDDEYTRACLQSAPEDGYTVLVEGRQEWQIFKYVVATELDFTLHAQCRARKWCTKQDRMWLQNLLERVLPTVLSLLVIRLLHSARHVCCGK